jgi:hypothetical protein
VITAQQDRFVGHFVRVVGEDRVGYCKGAWWPAGAGCTEAEGTYDVKWPNRRVTKHNGAELERVCDPAETIYQHNAKASKVSK